MWICQAVEPSELTQDELSEGGGPRLVAWGGGVAREFGDALEEEL